MAEIRGAAASRAMSGTGRRRCRIVRDRRLDRGRDPEDDRVTAARSDDLQAERQPSLVQTERQAERGMPGERHGVSQRQPVEIGASRPAIDLGRIEFGPRPGAQRDGWA